MSQAAGLDVAVAGGGVIGLLAALRLADDGHRVTVVDPDPTGASACATGSAGMVVPSHIVPLAAPGAVTQALRWLPDPTSPFHLAVRPSLDLARWAWRFARSATSQNVAAAAPVLSRLHRASREIYLDLHERLPQGIGLRTSGLLMLCTTEHGLRDETSAARFARGHEIPTELLDAATLRAAEPAVGHDVVGAVLYPLDCWLDPGLLLRAVRRRCDDAGVTVRQGRVTRLLRRSDRIVGLDLGSRHLRADTVVLAAGVHSNRLAAEIGIPLLVEGGRGYSLDIRPAGASLRRCAIHSEGRVAVTPLDGSVRVGGTMEVVAVTRPPDPRRLEGIWRSVSIVYPDLWAAGTERRSAWSGFRPVSADGMPHIGRCRTVDGLVIATGHGMMGISLAPITAVLVADAVAGRVHSAEPALDPERFIPWYRTLRTRRLEEVA